MLHPIEVPKDDHDAGIGSKALYDTNIGTQQRAAYKAIFGEDAPGFPSPYIVHSLFAGVGARYGSFVWLESAGC